MESTNNSWSVENFGGEKTKNISVKRAVFIGRYQPYHLGHTELINQKIKQGIPVLIMVRDIEPDENNPLKTEDAVAIIRAYHKLRAEDVEVMIIPDIESVNFGRGVGYEVNKYTPPDNIAAISATQIRDCIIAGDESWRRCIPFEIQNMVKKYLTPSK